MDMRKVISAIVVAVVIVVRSIAADISQMRLCLNKK